MLPRRAGPATNVVRSVADTWNSTVRIVDGVTGIINTVAGGGFGNFGDNIPARDAFLLEPTAVAVDSAGNLYIADQQDSRIRKVDAVTRLISTVAGSSLSFGDSGDGGPATAALLTFPRGVAVSDSGDIYISDGFNYKVRRVDASTGIIDTVAGIGVPRFSGDGGPASQAGLALTDGIAVDGIGNLYVSDQSNNRVRMIPHCGSVGSPSLSTPADGAQGLSSVPSLGWTEVDEAQRFDVYLDTVMPPEQVVAVNTQTTFFSPSNLKPLTTYYWKVVAKGDPFCEPFRTAESEVWSFTTTSECDVPGEFGAAGN